MDVIVKEFSEVLGVQRTNLDLSIFYCSNRLMSEIREVDKT